MRAHHDGDSHPEEHVGASCLPASRIHWQPESQCACHLHRCSYHLLHHEADAGASRRCGHTRQSTHECSGCHCVGRRGLVTPGAMEGGRRQLWSLQELGREKEEEELGASMHDCVGVTGAGDSTVAREDIGVKAMVRSNHDAMAIEASHHS